MSFLKRLKDATTSLGGVVTAPVGLVKDLTWETLGLQDEHDGVLGTIAGVSLDRFGKVADDIIGPRGVLGSAVNLVPRPARHVVNTGLDALETAYREGVAEPLSTAVTAASLSDRNRGNLAGFGDLLKGSTWRNAYAIAQHRSPGQAIALALGTRDILDRNEVNEFVGTDLYKVSSGLSDAAIRLLLSPDVVAGHGFTAARGKSLVRPIRSLEQIDGYFRGKHWAGVDEFIASLPDDKTRAARIRDRLFPQHHAGALIAHHLADAPDSAARESVMRFFMGDLDQLDTLYSRQEALATRLQRVLDEQAYIKAATDAEGTLFSTLFDVANAPERRAALESEMKDVVAKVAGTDQLEGGFAAIRQEPRLTVGGAVRQRVTRSDLYQRSTFTKPVRVFTNMRPHRMIDLNRADADVQVDRFLREFGVDQGARDAWRSRVMEALPEQRFNVVLNAEHEAFRSMASQYGLTSREVKEVLASAELGRTRTASLISESRYDGAGRARIRFDDPSGELIEYPLTLTQTANVYPAPDARLVKRALHEAGNFKARRILGRDLIDSDLADSAVAAALRGSRLPREAMHTVMSAWKPAVLLRPAWTVRVVLLDEQLRMLAKWGALSNGADFLRGAKNLTHSAMADLFGVGADGAVNARRASRAGAIAGGLTGTAIGGPAAGAVGAALGFGGGRALAHVSPSVYRQLDVNGFKIQAAFGADGDADAMYRALNSADDSVREILDTHETTLLDRLRSAGGWESIAPGSKDYGTAWERVVNDQFLKDPLARQVIEGKSVADMAEWLRSTPEGAKYRAALPMRRDVDTWAQTLHDVVSDYVPDVADLREKAATGGRLSYSDLEDAVPNLDAHPIVHGQSVDQILGKGIVSSTVQGLVDKGFKLLGTLPTDELSRNRYFRHVYEQEMRERLRDVRPGMVHEATVRKIETSAREAALTEVKNLLYDFAERSEFAEMTRLLIPFFPASQEVLTRWTGLAIENPGGIARGAKVYGGLYKLPDDGVISNYVDADDNEWVRFRIPAWARGLLNHGGLKSALDDMGYIRFDPKGLSALSSSMPSGGPFVQLAVAEVVKAKPELENSVKFMFPYGTPAGWKDAFYPAAFKRLDSAFAGGEENAARESARARILLTRLAKVRNGELPYVDFNDPHQRDAFIAAVDDETSAFFKLRAVASWISPTAPVFDSPYAAYIDAYRKKKETDPDGADEWFLHEFGDEFFGLTTSLTRSNNGVPPTLEGEAIGNHFAELIERYPEFGGLIIGSEGSGLTDKFARSVYDRQLATPIAPGSSTMQRERLTPEELTTAADTRLAWSKFSRAMDAIEAIRLQRGIPNLRVRGAEGLAEAKRQVVLQLAADHPAWANEYFATDARTWDRRIEALTAIATTPELQGRPAIDGLRKYLVVRSQFVNLLARRDSSDLRAKSNAELADAWDTITARLASEPAFGEVFSRWLDNDPVEAPMLKRAAA